MSELPARLRDAVASPTAFIKPAITRKLLFHTSEQGNISWKLSDTECYSLPEGEPCPDSRLLFVHSTPEGFERRWESHVFETPEKPNGEWLQLSRTAVLERWRRGEATIDAASLQAIVEPVSPGVQNAHGVTSLPLKSPTLPPATHTNFYCVGFEAPLLVDPGSPYGQELDDAEAAAHSWRADCGTPQAIFLTHHHADHVSGAEALKQRMGLPIWAHRETAARVSFEVDREIEANEQLGDWTALHTPGHAPGHLCLWNSKTRQLIAGDMVASIGSIVVEPTDGDMAAYLNSLESLKSLNARVAYPAHGAMIESPVERFSAYISHRLWREAQVVNALEQGDAELSELTARAYSDVNPAIHWLAERQALAHLLKLQVDERAQESAGVWSLRH